jgi:DUF971 family protein
MSRFRPVSIRRVENALAIEWDDGLRGTISFQRLRDNCPCASCNEKRQQPPNPLRVLTDAELRSGPLRPIAMPSRGSYAYQVIWSDGHDTGIYTLELLRKLCETA